MSGRTRAIGIAIVACGVLMMALPALPWYGASLPTGNASLTGYGAGGASWILPVIGVALVVTGVLAVWWSMPPGTRGARVIGGLAILWAVLGVAWSALDARRLGFEAVVLLEACRAIDLDGSLTQALAQMREAGVSIIAAAAASSAPPGSS